MEIFLLYILCPVFLLFGDPDKDSYYKNPIITDYNCQDASVIKEGEWYYMFSSFNISRDKTKKHPPYRANIFRSKDLLHWHFYKKAFDNQNTIIDSLPQTVKREYLLGKYILQNSNGYAAYHIWSPEIVKYGRRFLLFVTLRSNPSDSKIVLFETDDLATDFKFNKIIVSSNPADGNMYFESREIIDPFVVKDKGKLYLVFGSFARNLHGNIIQGREKIGVYIAELDKGLGIKKRPRFLTELYEGVVIYKHHNNYFLFGSNGNFKNNTYQLHYAKSKSIWGPYTNDKGENIGDTINVHFGTTLLETRDSDFIYNGFGCMSKPILDDSHRYWTLVNGHDMTKLPISTRTAQEERYEFLLELLWDDDGNPYFNMDQIQNNRINKPRFK